MDTVQTAFDKAYWASQLPELEALPAISDMGQRTTRAAALAAQAAGHLDLFDERADLLRAAAEFVVARRA